MNVVGYLRVSTQGQARDGYSLKYQEDEIRAFCKEQGLNLIHNFRDEGISGAKLDEEALEIDRVGLRFPLVIITSFVIVMFVDFETDQYNGIPRFKIKIGGYYNGKTRMGFNLVREY